MHFVLSGSAKIKVAGLTITALPAEHTVPAVGYHLDSGEGSLGVHRGTRRFVNDRFWPVRTKSANCAT